MRRTQLYLDENLWDALHAQARQDGTTISELVRQALRERYLSNLEERRKAMMAVVGIRKGPFKKSALQEVRELRKDRRIDRLFKK